MGSSRRPRVVEETPASASPSSLPPSAGEEAVDVRHGSREAREFAEASKLVEDQDLAEDQDLVEAIDDRNKVGL
ncbi:hypothetical protein E2562_000628 [Oryza meyeriana var. granulata]|uniref:Uncharacterized protein n=1 Tax=Oryza meyeriana var. granulata TaxID=110450 RepID=A0A6G1DTP2_9ORYZ|nr:hypothetical protein E2562_000628 [Oryza meyeriana var. granulata]